ncbi:calcium-binding protein, partial [Xanthobacter sediminis]
LNGGLGADQLYGGNGDDVLVGGAGADQFAGGDGTDTASYVDSTVAMTFNLATGVFSGIGAGDTFDGIEVIAGTNYGDTFIASSNTDHVNGGNGVDMITYADATSAIGINLVTGGHTGLASEDVFTNVEVIHGTAYDDTFVGDNAANIFIGGAGADSFDGGAGIDSLWYLTSASGVTINLATGTLSGGDATGDIYTNIERFIGSNHDDNLIAGATGTRLEGGGGDDTITGGAGADIIFGGLGTDVGAVGPMPGGNQADTIDGGDGNDEIYSAGNNQGQTFNYGNGIDLGTVIKGGGGADRIVISSGTAYGDSGNDTITVFGNGSAHGGAGADTLNGEYIGFELYGDDGEDTLNLKLGGGFADGGNNGDIYYVDTVLQSTIKDTGSSGNDYVYLQRIATVSDLLYSRQGDDLIIYSDDDAAQYPNAVVRLENWYDGFNTIEFFATADGTHFSGSVFA